LIRWIFLLQEFDLEIKDKKKVLKTMLLITWADWGLRIYKPKQYERHSSMSSCMCYIPLQDHGMLIWWTI
jgi:hypothetical protein